MKYRVYHRISLQSNCALKMTKSEYLEVFNSADFFQILTLLGMVHLFLTPTGAFVEQDPYVE